MFKVNVNYENEEGELIKTEQRDLLVEFEMDVTPEILQAAEEAEKTVEDLVAETIFTELQSKLALSDVPPLVSVGSFPRITPGPAFVMPEREAGGVCVEMDETSGGPPLVEEG